MAVLPGAMCGFMAQTLLQKPVYKEAYQHFQEVCDTDKRETELMTAQETAELYGESFEEPTSDREESLAGAQASRSQGQLAPHPVQ